MSEDVSATMRVGITVILVAALVATVLNLMVMSNSLLSGGQTTLQSGIDSVSQQEFASYNNAKVSGTQVNTAISLFQGRDVAICIQTKTFKENYCSTASQGEGYFMNYGAIISASQNASVKPSCITATVADGVMTASGTGTIPNAFNGKMTSLAGSTPGNYYIAGLGASFAASDATQGGKAVGRLTQKQGAPTFTALLWDENGIVQSNSNIIGCSALGNPQYLLSSARFQSILIKDSTGSIIGIAFYQI